MSESEQEEMKKVRAAITKLRMDLEWVSQSGKKMGVIVLSRELALPLLRWAERLARSDKR